MKRFAFLFILSTIGSLSHAQQTQVTRSLFGIQANHRGLWIYNEARLASPLALRTEVGLVSSSWGLYNHMNSVYKFMPSVTLEPRWYYNLDKRASKSRSTDRNSANYVALAFQYRSNDAMVAYEDVSRYVASDLSVVASWGIRRNMGKYFNLEAGPFVGYQHFFEQDIGREEDSHGFLLGLRFRIGLDFYTR